MGGLDGREEVVMRLLVIRFSSFGDCVLLCPFLEHLKHHGAGDVAVVTKTAYVGLFSAARGVDRLIALDPKAGLRGLRHIVESHRSDGCTVIDAHNTLRSRILSAGLGGARSRIQKHFRKRFELITLKRGHELPTMSQRYSALGEALGFPPMTSGVGGIEIPRDARRRAGNLLRDVERPLLVLAPGGRWPMKRWGVEKFEALARRAVSQLGYRVVLVGDHADAAVTTRMATAIDEGVTDLAGRLEIMETAAVIETADAFVGGDSGLMHLAEAVGTPVVALFGPTVEAFGYFPSLAASKVVERDLPCRPCSRNGGRPCPKGTQECLVDLPLQAVEQALDDLLADRGPQRYVLN